MCTCSVIWLLQAKKQLKTTYLERRLFSDESLQMPSSAIMIARLYDFFHNNKWQSPQIETYV